MCFTIRHGKRLGETLKLPRLSSLGSFKLQRLGLVSEGIVHIPVYHRLIQAACNQT